MLQHRKISDIHIKMALLLISKQGSIYEDMDKERLKSFSLFFINNSNAITCYFCYNYYAAAAAAKSLQSCPTLRSHRRQPTRLPYPWDSLGKNTGVDCHFLLQCMKVKSQSEVAQSCPTLSDPMDCSLPGSSVHGIFQARVLEWGAIAFSYNYYNDIQKHKGKYEHSKERNG